MGKNRAHYSPRFQRIIVNYLHENEKSFPYQRLSNSPRFDTEAQGNSEMAYSEPARLSQYFCPQLSRAKEDVTQNFVIVHEKNKGNIE